MTVAIVLLNYNGASLLDNYLPSILKYTPSDVLVYVIDNGSTDNSVTILEQYPELHIIKLPQNLGFAGGYNAGLKKVSADLYVLLNTDVRVTAGWLTPVVEVMKDPAVGVSVPKIKSDRHPDAFEYAGAAGGYLDRFGYAFCRGRVFDVIEQDRGQYDDVVDLHWAGGCAMAIRGTLFDTLGGFDNAFFAHYEEIDLCWRVRRCGYSVRYVPKSVIYHLGGGTMSYDSPRKLMLNFRNSLFMLSKNLPTGHLLPKLLTRMILDGVASVVFMVEGRWTSVRAVLDAHLGFYRHIPRLIRQRKLDGRRIDQARRKTVQPASLSKVMLIWQFFILRRKTFAAMHERGAL